ncbi:MAG: SRPBCC domain-containing protein [Solirubrobacteraceae bacterium]
MATTEDQFAVSPERVFAVLSDPESYADWVVGSHSIRDADPGWPAVGARFHHRVGVGGLTVNDHTEVLEADPPRRIVLRARARPLGTARVEIVLAPRAGGTHVTMTEVAGDPLSKLALNRLTDPLVHHRNRESLQRLRRISETGVLKT